MTELTRSLVIAAMVVVRSVAPAQEAAATDSVRRSILEDRARESEWLRSSPTSYLAAVARTDYGDRQTLTLGSDALSDVVVRDPSILPKHLFVTVQGDSFRVRAGQPGATFRTSGGREHTSAVVPTSYVHVGRFIIRLSHQRFPAIIVFDPDSPQLRAGGEQVYFPVDLTFRFRPELVRRERPDTVVILSTRGNRRNALEVGWFRFSVGSVVCSLQVTRLLEPGVGENSYSIFFRDATSGRETYGLGRYVEAEEMPDGSFILDFNRAYNPACAWSDHYNCPIPPEGNTLTVAIRAGEKNPAGAH